MQGCWTVMDWLLRIYATEANNFSSLEIEDLIVQYTNLISIFWRKNDITIYSAMSYLCATIQRPVLFNASLSLRLWKSVISLNMTSAFQNEQH